MQYPQPVTLKEIRSHGTKLFPCAIYHTHSANIGALVKPHWHDEVEVLYFFGGDFQLEINMEKFHVNSECLYFINPGELHSIIMETAGCYEDIKTVLAYIKDNYSDKCRTEPILVIIIE